MIELFILAFVSFSSLIVWLRPLYLTVKQRPTREWLEYWVVLSMLVFAELYLFQSVPKTIQYNSVRTISLFLFSERANSKNRSSAYDLPQMPINSERLTCNNIAEQLMHLDSLSQNTKVSILEKLLMCTELSPVTFNQDSTWADPSKTIRGVAACELAELASSNQLSKGKIKEYAESKIPELLIAMLQGNELSDRDNALLAMSSLADKNKKMQQALFEKHVLDHLKSVIIYGVKPQACRLALGISRKIFRERNQAKDEFMRSKMTVELIKLLNSEVKELVAEAAQAVNDLVMQDDSAFNTKILKIMANQGLNEAIQKAIATHGADSKLKIQLKMIETLINSA